MTSSQGKMENMTDLAYFNFEEILGRAIDFIEALLARIRHGLHRGESGR